jgi:hypothetical protein
MAITYITHDLDSNPIDIFEFVNRIQAGERKGLYPGLLPRNMNNIKVPITYLPPNAASFIQFGDNSQLVLAPGLITCAAVIYVSAQVQGAWVHHANAGYIAPGDVKKAIEALDKPSPKSLYVLYAHPGETDKGYMDSMQNIANFAQIPINNIIEMPNIPCPCLGVNNAGQIGV